MSHARPQPTLSPDREQLVGVGKGLRDPGPPEIVRLRRLMEDERFGHRQLELLRQPQAQTDEGFPASVHGRGGARPANVTARPVSSRKRGISWRFWAMASSSRSASARIDVIQGVRQLGNIFACH